MISSILPIITTLVVFIALVQMWRFARTISLKATEMESACKETRKDFRQLRLEVGALRMTVGEFHEHRNRLEESFKAHKHRVFKTVNHVLGRLSYPHLLEDKDDEDYPKPLV